MSQNIGRRSPRKKRVILSDIANESGVSLAAVSLALSDKPGISQETRERVIQTANSLGYRFKNHNSTVTFSTIKTIGLLVKATAEDEPHANHFYSHIITGIESVCRQNKINLMFANLAVDSENFPLEVPVLLSQQGDVDGIILAGAHVSQSFASVLDAANLPVVLVDAYSDARMYDSILSDNAQGACLATEYLIQKGHKHIAFIGPDEHAYPSFRERRAGYLQAMTGHQRLQTCFASCPAERSVAGPRALELLKANPKVTALAAVNDDVAIAVMLYLIKAGYRVPQDLSIIGFDDIYLAESVAPSLTTMRVNKQGMGRLAVQMLINQVSQGNSGCVASIFRPVLIERNSVAAI